MFPVLETPRVILREINEHDAHRIYECFSNQEAMQYYGQEPLENMDQARNLIKHFEQIVREKRGIRWGIQIKGHGELIGTIGFNAWSPKYKRADIGYEIHPNYWRKGYATEVIPKILTYGFEEMDLARIGAIVFIQNQASNKVLTNLGFEKEGILRNYIHQHGVSYDTYVYSILNSNERKKSSLV